MLGRFFMRKRVVFSLLLLLAAAVYLQDRYGTVYFYTTQDYHPLPHTYVINLDRDTERYQFMKEQLNRVGMEHERFPAVDGYKLEIEDLSTGEVFLGQEIKNGRSLSKKAKYLVHCPTTDWIYNFSRRKQYLKAGEFGCVASHLEVLKDMKEKGYEFALVLEDDVRFCPGFREEIDVVLHHLPSNWDLCYLYYSKNAAQQAKSLYQNPCVKKLPLGTAFTCAYLVHHSAIDRLLKALTTCNRPVDYMYRTLTKHKKVAAYAAYPMLVEHDCFTSTIKEMGRNH